MADKIDRNELINEIDLSIAGYRDDTLQLENKMENTESYMYFEVLNKRRDNIVTALNQLRTIKLYIQGM